MYFWFDEDIKSFSLKSECPHKLYHHGSLKVNCF